MEEKTNWRKEAEEEAEECFNFLKGQWDKKELKEKFETGEHRDYSIEYADGKFIYNDNESLKDALDCLSELSDYEETDSGLWEGLNNYAEELNARATYTFRNYLDAVLEEKIKEYLEIED